MNSIRQVSELESLRAQVADLARELAVRDRHDGIWDWNIQSGDVFFSTRWKSMRGYEDQDLTHSLDEWRSRIHPDDLDSVLHSLDQYLAKQRTEFCEEYRVRRKDGSYLWVLGRGVAQWADDGSALRVTGTESDITERKQTEEALIQSIERFDLAAQGSRDGLWDVLLVAGDPFNVGNPVFYSPRMKEIMGVRGEGLPDVLGTWVTLLHPDDRERVFTAISAHLAQRIPYDIEYRILRKDGECRWIAAKGQAQWNEAGDPVRMSGSFSDITERKQVEEALRESEERYRLITDATFDGIAIHDQGIMIEVNSGLERMFGYGPGELIGKHVLDVVADESREMVIAKMRAGEQGPYESVGRRKDGSTLYGEVVIKPCRYKGRDARLVAGRDITERKRAELELTQLSRKIELILSSAGEGIFGLDSEGIVTFANPSFAKMLGWQPEEMIRQAGHEQWHHSHQDGSPYSIEDCPIHSTFRDGIARSCDRDVFWRKDGSSLPVEYRCTPIVDKGLILGAVVSCHDIAERKRAADELWRSHAFIRQIIDTDPNFIFAKDRDGRFVLVNKALAAAYGTTVDKLIGKTDADFNANQEEVAFFRQKDLAVMDSLQDLLIPEERITDSDGKTRWLQTVKRPILDEQGRASMVLGVATDITERKLAEEVLRQTADRLSLATRAGGVGIWDWDFVQNVLTWDDQMCALYGITRDGFSGSYEAWKASVFPEDVERADAEIQMALRGEKDFDAEFRVCWPNGTTRNIRALTTVQRDAFGHPSRMIGINWDVTERKRTEEALRHREQDLSVAIEERERISQDLHDDILQSLFAVGLGLEASKSTRSLRNRKNADAALDQAVNQLNSVIREVRNFIAGLGADPLQGRDLPTALRHMLKSLTQNQALHVRLAMEDRAVRTLSMGQALHVFQVIREAVSNCLRHGRAREATVTLKMLKRGVRLSIRDNGCGFNPDAVKGTGHGLINMATRAQKMGGRLTVFSKVNEGARVVLDLPKGVLNAPC